ncbi:hypothetical protein HMI56_006199 [Coelomomyces lativittatus]|nr:hypothetical protein HMI56_006199 [Coelomomyces lativittatus]
MVQKRIKEEAWIRAPGEPLDIQFQEAWDTLQPLTKTDLDFVLKQAEVWENICCHPIDELQKSGWPK